MQTGPHILQGTALHQRIAVSDPFSSGNQMMDSFSPDASTSRLRASATAIRLNRYLSTELRFVQFQE